MWQRSYLPPLKDSLPIYHVTELILLHFTQTNYIMCNITGGRVKNNRKLNSHQGRTHPQFGRAVPIPPSWSSYSALGYTTSPSDKRMEREVG